MGSSAFRCTFPIQAILLLGLGSLHLAAQQKSHVETTVSSGLQQVIGIQQQATPDGILVTIQLQKRVEYEVGQATGPDRLFIDLSATETGPGLNGLHIHGQNGILRQIRVAQYQPTATRVVLDLNQMVLYHVGYLSDPPRLTIEMHPERPVRAQTAPSKLEEDTGPKPAFLQPATVKPSFLSSTVDSRKRDVPKLSAPEPNGSSQLTKGETYDLAAKNVRDADLFRLMQRADSGDVESQLMLGFAHELGSFGSVNYASAMRWYRRAANQGNTAAAIRIGDMYALGRGVPRDTSAARKWYVIAGLGSQSADSRAAKVGAKSGLVMSDSHDARLVDQPNLHPDYTNQMPAETDKVRGQRESAVGPGSWTGSSARDSTVNGLGSADREALLRLPFDPVRDVPSDPAAAAKMYRKASDQGFAEAQFRLANMYMTGQGVERNQAEAAKLYTRAAQRGHPVAQSNLGVLYANGWGVAGNDAEAVNWFKRAATRGDVGGESNLGTMYLSGRGTPQDDDEAAKWLRKAAEKGQAEAQYGLGTLYANGRGVPRDNAEAVKWFKKASGQGYAPARLALATMYAAGQGTARDEQQAAAYIRGAAEQGLPDAQYQLGLLYQQGRGVAKSDDEAMRWFNLAAAQGLPAAEYQLGEIYRDGKGADKNLVTAYSWFALAAATGYEDAMSSLNSLAPRMTLNQIADGQRLAITTAPHLKANVPDTSIIVEKGPVKVTDNESRHQ